MAACGAAPEPAGPSCERVQPARQAISVAVAAAESAARRVLNAGRERLELICPRSC